MWTWPCHVCSGSAVVTAYHSESGRPGSNPEWGLIYYEALITAQGLLGPSSSGVVHWVPEQLNIKAVTGACKLIDGCSLALCSATVSVVSAGIRHRNEVNSIAWLYRRAQPKDSIHYITLRPTEGRGHDSWGLVGLGLGLVGHALSIVGHGLAASALVGCGLVNIIAKLILVCSQWINAVQGKSVSFTLARNGLVEIFKLISTNFHSLAIEIWFEFQYYCWFVTRKWMYSTRPEFE